MSRLNDKHLKDLASSGILPEVAEACELYSASERQVRDILGFQAGPGLVFPFPGDQEKALPQYLRVKLDVPPLDENEKPKMKYASPKGAKNRLYICPLFHRAILEDASQDILITEGEKKAIKGCHDGFPTISINGIYGWRSKDDEGNSIVVPELDEINFVGRQVGIVFDSDAATKANVANAESRLLEELRNRGAHAFTIRLPRPNRTEQRVTGGKFGLDDFLVARCRNELRYLIERSRNPLPLECRPATVLGFRTTQDRPFLVEGMIKKGDCFIFAGGAKSKKSLLTMELAICIALGEPFLGLRVAKGRVIMVDEETDETEFAKRLEGLAAARGRRIGDLGHVHYLAKDKLKLDDEYSMGALEMLCREIEPSLVILDPFVRLHSQDENSTQSISPLLQRLRRLSVSQETSILLVHHFGKGASSSPASKMRGSSDLHGWYDGAGFFESRTGTIQITFENRYCEALDPIKLRLSVEDDEVMRWVSVVDDNPHERPAPQLPDFEDLILSALRDGPIKKSEVASTIRRNAQATGAALTRLHKKELIRFEKGESSGGSPPTYVTLAQDSEDFFSSDFSSSKEEGEDQKEKKSGHSTSGGSSENPTGNGDDPSRQTKWPPPTVPVDALD